MPARLRRSSMALACSLPVNRPTRTRYQTWPRIGTWIVYASYPLARSVRVSSWAWASLVVALTWTVHPASAHSSPAGVAAGFARFAGVAAATATGTGVAGAIATAGVCAVGCGVAPPGLPGVCSFAYDVALRDT